MRRLFFYIAVGTLVFLGCRKKLERPSWDVDMLAPVARTSIGINDLIKDTTLLQVNIDNSITVVFQNDIASFKLDSLFEIPDTTISEQFTVPISVNVNPGQQFLGEYEETQYNLGDVELVYAEVRTGSITVDLQNTLNEGVIATFQIVSATKNGDTLEVVEFVPANSTICKTYPMDGYALDLRGSSYNSFNTLITDFEAQLDPNAAGQITVTPSDIFKMDLTFGQIIPEYARGYFGSFTEIVGPETQPNDFMANIVGGTIDLDQVDLIFGIRNEVGVDIQAEIINLTSYNSWNSATVNLSHPIIGQAQNLNRAFDNSPNQPTIIPGELSFTMNNSNSNVDQFIENLPDELGYGIDLEINPLGNISGGNDFIYYDTGLDIYLDAEVPITLASDQLTYQDTTDFNFGEKDTTLDDHIFIGNLAVYADNGFPFDATVEFYLMDESYNITDTLLGTGTIDAGKVDGSLRVVEKTSSVLYIPVSNAIVDNLYEAKYIMLKVSMTTTQQPQLLKIYSDYSIDLKFVADVNYIVKLD